MSDDALSDYVDQLYAPSNPDMPASGGSSSPQGVDPDEAALATYIEGRYPVQKSPNTSQVLGDAWKGAKLAGHEMKLGAQQWLDRAEGNDEDLQRLQNEIAESRGDYDTLTGAGKFGYGATKFAPWVGASLLLKKPILGGALIGGGSSALEPTLDNETTGGIPNKYMNPAIGAALGVLGDIGGSAVGRYFGSKLDRAKQALEMSRAKNATRDNAAQRAHDLGYALLPTEANPEGKLAAVGEAMGGGKLPSVLEQGNLDVTDSLVRRALGLPDDKPLERATFEDLRSQAGQAYDTLRGVKQINADDQFANDLGSIIPSTDTATKLPSDTEIADAVANLKAKKTWTGSDFLEEVRRLRELENSSWNSARIASDNNKQRISNMALADAYGKMADRLESLGERGLEDQGLDPGMINAYRDARKRMALSYDVERSMNNGHVDPKAIRLLVKRRQGNTSPNLNIIAETREQFPRSLAVPRSTASISPWEALWGESALIGASAHPSTFGKYAGLAIAPLAGRIAIRKALATRTGQRMLARSPSYEPGITDTLPAAMAPLYRSTLDVGLPLLGRQFFPDRENQLPQ